MIGLMSTMFDISFSLGYFAYYGDVAELCPDTRMLYLELAAEHDLPLFIAIIEHECVHQILYDLIDVETCEAYDNIARFLPWAWRGEEPSFWDW